eukprot:jgi/Tetstr1/441935/TSEL_030142.t1
MDLARKAGHMLTGQHDPPAGAATSSTMADLEAMFSRILEKSQAAHGCTGAMRLAVEVPDPFLDCVDTDDHGTLLHGVSCVELPLRSARNPELRMRRPGWDAQREQLTKQRPQGFEPAVEQEGPASYEGRRGGGAITSDMLDIRNQHSCSTCARRYSTPSSLVYLRSLKPTFIQWAWCNMASSLWRLGASYQRHHSLELQQLREVQRRAYPDYPEYDRHSAFYVDCKLTVIVIGGVRILMALLDTGCDYNGVHWRVVDRMKPGEVDATMQSMSMQRIGGKMEMQRLVGRITYVINPDTDWERKFEWPSFAILGGDHLPDVIFWHDATFTPTHEVGTESHVGGRRNTGNP